MSSRAEIVRSGRRRKSASKVGQFLKLHYGLDRTDISAKMRSVLLQEVEHVPCNLCGRDECQPVANYDKYGLPLNTVICKGCGLLYLNPRPTASAYARFYEEGGQRDSAYHRRIDFDSVEDLLKFYYGPAFAMSKEDRRAMAKYMSADDSGLAPRAIDLDDIDDEDDDPRPERKRKSRSMDYYALHIYETLKHLVPVGGKVFEPGASWGKMLQPWQELHHCQATGIEPKKSSVVAARERLGIELLQGFASDPRIPENTYDLVFIVRTINHMLDPLGDLRNAWRWLKPDGILFIDIADAIKEARFEGFGRGVAEVDHPYMFSLSTLAAMVQKAGFTIIKQEITDLQQARPGDNRAPQPKQIRITARKSGDPVAVGWPDPMTELATLLQAQLEFDRDEQRRYAHLWQRNEAIKKEARMRLRNRLIAYLRKLAGLP